MQKFKLPKNRRGHLTHAAEQTILGLLKKGYGQRQIAQMCGIGKSTVQRICRENDIRFQRSTRPVSKWERERILTLESEGRSRVEIANETGRSKHTILRILREAGREIRPQNDRTPDPTPKEIDERAREIREQKIAAMMRGEI